MGGQINIYPFNNSVETGLRVLCLLNALFPRSYDLETLVCLDYLCVHSADFDQNLTSLHPDNPNRQGELFVRRSIMEDGLRLFISRKLITLSYTQNGIEYQASELSANFLDKFYTSYSIALIKRSEWISDLVSDKLNSEIQEMVKQRASNYAFQVLRK